MALSIAPATGQQTTTQNPQAISGQNISASTQSSGIQPGTSTDLLNSTQGETLGAPSLTAVSLVNTGTRTETSAPGSGPASKPAHHVNAALFVIPVALVLMAAAMFWYMTRSAAKSTTN